MMQEDRPIMVMAGGTGGHVFPALTVAEYLRSQGETIVWIGTRSGIEARLVPAAGFPIEWLRVQGLRGKGLVTRVMAPFKLMIACWQALIILRRNNPRVVLGMGGFAAGPGGLMAWLMRIPLVIHEQNAVAGLTNRILSHISRISFFAFPEAAKGIKRSSVVGNPVRQELLSIATPQQRLASRSEAMAINLLVIGGSLGARTLNQVLPAALAKLDREQRPRVRHQCGAGHEQDCRQLYQQQGITADISPFIDDMKAAYEWADLVVCRAGAMTIAELSAVGIASILVPFPYAVDDHQFFNAEYLVQAAAAIRIRENEFNGDLLAGTLSRLIEDRKELFNMACHARAVSYSNATEQIAAGVLREARS